MLNKKRGQKGFTLIELLIVIAIIGILAAIAIPMYRAQTVKARISEVTNSMSAVASGVGNFYQDNGAFPAALAGATAINATLGVALPTAARYFVIDAAANPTISAAGVISFTVRGTGDTGADALALILTPTTDANGAITWSWASSTVNAAYRPRQ